MIHYDNVYFKKQIKSPIQTNCSKNKMVSNMLRDSFDFNKLVFSLYKYGAKIIKIKKTELIKKHAKSLYTKNS